jgi:putative hydrolase of the HAD superfamily
VNRRDHVLLIDADDTLWENNIYFERAIAGFTEHLRRFSSASAETIRERINAQERRIIVEMGYGLESFQIALGRAYQDIAPEAWNGEARTLVGSLARQIAAEPIELMPGAAETL